MRTLILLQGLILLALVTTESLFAQGSDPDGCAILDFETVPGQTPFEGLLINDQFEESLGISFILEDGTFPRLAEVGRPTTAFEPRDTPDGDQDIGSFFLTDDGLVTAGDASPLLVTFSTPVDSATGVILDIDFSETFTITAYDSSGQVVEEIVINAGDEGTGDGVATPWSFRRADADVASIRFAGTRDSGRFGLAFDNFATCAPARPPISPPAPVGECEVLDFESVPNESASEGLLISDQFEDILGISFVLEDGTFPRLAEIGQPTTAFEPGDTPDADQDEDIGSFFLTDDGQVTAGDASPLIVTFSNPVDSASGVVLDIDFTETFTITAFDDAGQVLEESVINAGDEGTGNGIATPWSFRRPQADVASVRFAGTRDSGRFGLAFDNFATCAPARTTSVDHAEVPITFVQLDQNYPNPFSGSTAIGYQLFETVKVRLEIYTLLGQKLATLVHATQLPGRYEVGWTADGLGSGTYVYRLVTPDGSADRLLTVLKSGDH